MRIALFALTDVKAGGWLSYTAHLRLGLQALGHDVALFRVGDRTESKGRPWGQGLTYRNVNRSRAFALAQEYPSIITVAAPKRKDDTELLLRAGAHLVIHDPTELRGKAGLVVGASLRPVVVIRKANTEAIKDLGATPQFIPHPYMRDPSDMDAVAERVATSENYRAVSISRIDFDKNIDVIAEANARLDPDYRIHIYGAENRLYTHHKLDKEHPDWRDSYHGQWNGDTPYGGKALAERAQYVVDMSTIKGDGGGTQYTMLEAWDAGAVCIVHAEWSRPTPKGLPVVSVEDADDLVNVVQSDPDEHAQVRDRGFKQLKQHDAKKIAAAYVELVSA